MDAQYRIYEEDPDKIPIEDRTRLEGYLKGRADSDKEAMIEELMHKFEILERAQLHGA
jgi:hypothetical protein